MYTLAQITEALRRFATWSSDEPLRRSVAELLESGELEVVGIVDGEFVWRKMHREPAEVRSEPRSTASKS